MEYELPIKEKHSDSVDTERVNQKDRQQDRRDCYDVIKL